MGTWNPKEEKLKVVFKVKDLNAQKVIQKALSDNLKFVLSMKDYVTIEALTEINDPELFWIKIPEKIDQDFLVKIYAWAGYKNAGLYKNVTYNGNLTLDFLPTSKSENPTTAFYQGVYKAPLTNNAPENCLEAMKKLIQIMY